MTTHELTAILADPAKIFRSTNTTWDERICLQGAQHLKEDHAMMYHWGISNYSGETFHADKTAASSTKEITKIQLVVFLSTVTPTSSTRLEISSPPREKKTRALAIETFLLSASCSRLFRFSTFFFTLPEKFGPFLPRLRICSSFPLRLFSAALCFPSNPRQSHCKSPRVKEEEEEGEEVGKLKLCENECMTWRKANCQTANSFLFFFFSFLPFDLSSSHRSREGARPRVQIDTGHILSFFF